MYKTIQANISFQNFVTKVTSNFYCITEETITLHYFGKLFACKPVNYVYLCI